MSFNDFRSPWTGSDSAVESFLNRLRVFDGINFSTMPMLFVLIPAAQILNPFWVFAPNQTRPPKLSRLMCVPSTLCDQTAPAKVHGGQPMPQPMPQPMQPMPQPLQHAPPVHQPPMQLQPMQPMQHPQHPQPLQAQFGLPSYAVTWWILVDISQTNLRGVEFFFGSGLIT